MVHPDSLSGHAETLANGTTTPVELVEQALERAEKLSDLNAFVALDPEVVRVQAQAATARRKAGIALSPIDGIPIAVKDNYLTLDFPTTACSAALPDDPGNVDATVVASLRAAGAIIFGKTNMHEWAFGGTNLTSSFGATRNPLDRACVTGGSSGGSGAAVAGGIVGAALGSDTGGSVRIPAAACGIYGFKPSYGRVSRHGILALSWSLDIPGPLTREIDDIELLLPYFFKPDRHDPTTWQAPRMRTVNGPANPRLMYLTGIGLERSDSVEAAVSNALDRSGLLVTTTVLDQIESYFAAWEAILHCEATAYHLDRLATVPEKFTPVTRAHLEAGKQITAQELLRAQQIRTTFIQQLWRLLSECDALVLPTLPIITPRATDEWQTFGGRDITTQDSMTWFCWIANLAGLPAMSIPIPVPKSALPAGLMLMGRPGQDEELLHLATRINARLR